MLTGSLNSHALTESAKAGAVGFLIKGGGRAQLIDAVRAVAAGGTAWPGNPCRSQ
jgi:DNA-binding NarL/FixJ family response regulator